MKTFKKVLSFFLCLLFAGSSVVADGSIAGYIGKINASAEEYNTGDTIYYGSYPQSEVKDPEIKTELMSLAEEWQNYGYYSENEPSDYMGYTDVELNGNKYRGVVFTAYRPRNTSSPASDLIGIQKDNGYEVFTSSFKFYWFKYEPLNWRVLDNSSGLIMCCSIIDSQPYNRLIVSNGTDNHGNIAHWGDSTQTYYANNYTKSSIRQWLNEDFYNVAFSEAEKSNIKLTTLKNDCPFNDYSYYDAPSTNDKVFLLSYDEVTSSEYGFDANALNEVVDRRFEGSDYAKCQGLWVDGDSGWNGLSNWWLRSSGKYSDHACSVNNSGSVSEGNDINRTDCGIVPCLKLHNLTSNPPEIIIEPVKLTVSEQGNEWKKSVEIDLNVSGGNTESLTLTYSIDSGEETVLDTGVSICSIPNSVLPDGEHTVTVTANDSYTTDSRTVSYKKDSIPPAIGQITCAPANDEWTNQTVILTVEANDEMTGLAEEAYSFDGGDTWQASQENTYISNATLDSVIAVRDKLGNVAVYDREITISNIDKTSPVITFDEFDSSKWQKEFTVTGTVADDLSGVAGVYRNSEKLTLEDGAFSVSSESLAEGNKSVAITATDNAGNTSTNSIYYRKDISAPVINFDSSYSGWYKSLNIQGTAKDTYSGISYVKYSLDNGVETELEIINNRFIIENTLLPEGKHTVKLTAVDNVGLSSEKSVTYNKDSVAPEISSVTYVPYNEWTQFVNVTVSASDEHSGLASKAYSFDGGATWQYSPTKKYVENAVIDSMILVKDNAGNITAYDEAISLEYIDTVKPVIQFNDFDSENWQKEFAITGSVSDNLSGIADVGYGSNALNVENGQFTIAGTALSEGSNTLTVWATDKAANKAQKSIVYKKDVSAPVISFSGSYSNWAKSVTVTGTITDRYSGLSEVKYSIDSGEKANISLNNGRFEIDDSILPSGLHTITVFSTDNVGNTSEKSISYKKDTTNPEIQITVESAEQWTQSKKVTITALDSESGLAVQPYSFDGGVTWQTGFSRTYTENCILENDIMIRDKVGNTITCPKVVISKIDREAPTITSVSKSTTKITPNPVTIRITAEDSISGVASFSFDGGSTWQNKPDKEYTKNTVVKSGSVKVKDKAGNITSFNEEIKINNIYDYNLKVKVVNEVGDPVADATVIFNIGSSSAVRVQSDASGIAKCMCNGDTCQVGAIKDKYTPDIITTNVSDDCLTEITIVIAKQPIVDGSLDVHRMTLEEIEKAGIDVDDPENSYVCEIHATFIYDDIPYSVDDFFVEKPREPGGSGGSGGSGWGWYVGSFKGKPGTPSKPGGGGGSNMQCMIMIPENHEDCSVLAIIDLPVKASILKEFFAVSIHLVNNAPEIINISNNSVKLNLPEGLTLMEGLDGYVSSTELSFDSFVGQEVKDFNWIVRGDDAGNYNLSVTYDGTIDLFDTSFSAKFATEDPITVYGPERVTLIEQPEKKIVAGGWYINLGIRNDCPVDIYRPRIEPLPGLINVIKGIQTDESEFELEQLAMRYENSLGFVCYIDEEPDVLAPGETVFYEYVVYGAVPPETTWYLKQWFTTTFSGYNMNVEFDPIEMNHYDMTDYFEKYKLLDTDNKDAFDYLYENSNYIYPALSSFNGDILLQISNYIAHKEWEKIKTLEIDFSYLKKTDQKKAVYSLLYTLLTSQEFKENIQAKNRLTTAKNIKKALELLEPIASGDHEKTLKNLLSDTNKTMEIADEYIKNGSSGVTEKLIEFEGVFFLNYLRSIVDCGLEQYLDNSLMKSVGKVFNGAEDIAEKVIEYQESYMYANQVYSTLLTLESFKEESFLLLDTITGYLESPSWLKQNYEIPNFLTNEIRTIVLNECSNVKNQLLTKIDSTADIAIQEFMKDIGIDAFEFAAKQIIKHFAGKYAIVVEIVGQCIKAIDNTFNISDTLLDVDGMDICMIFTSAIQLGIDSMRNAEKVTYNGTTLSTDERAYYTMMYIRFLSVCRWAGETYVYDLVKLHPDISNLLKANGIDLEDCYKTEAALVLKSRDKIFQNFVTHLEREPAPEVTINYDTCQTNQSFDETYEYCFGDGIWKKCNSNPISFTIKGSKQILRVRKAETELTASGSITAVTIFSRPTISKSIIVDYSDGLYTFTNLRNGPSYQMIPLNSKSVNLNSLDWSKSFLFLSANNSSFVSTYIAKDYVVVRSKRNDSLCELESEPVVLKVNNFGNPKKILVNEETNTAVIGSVDFTPNSTLSVKILNEGDDYNNVKSAFAEAEYLQVYDICIVENGKRIQPKGNVTVQLPVTDAVSKGNIDIYYYDVQNGQSQKMHDETDDNYIRFNTDHFSIYVIADKAPENPVTPETPVNPTANVKISVKSDEVYKNSKVTVIAKATGLPDGYVLAIYDGGKKPIATGSKSLVKYKIQDEVTATKSLTVKVIDKEGNAQKDANGKDLSENIEIKVKSGFLNLIIAFFKKLFRRNEVIIEP